MPGRDRFAARCTAARGVVAERRKRQPAARARRDLRRLRAAAAHVARADHSCAGDRPLVRCRHAGAARRREIIDIDYVGDDFRSNLELPPLYAVSSGA
jgi:hypothetical protein